MFSTTTAAVLSPSHAPQIEGANFLNLLIVDDDRTIREACREVAQSLGFNTQVAESAEQAYRLLDSSSTDAVMLDLRLPGAGGLEALHTIKKHRADALVIVVTGYGTVKSAVQAKLLRAIQEKEIRPVGSVKRVPINVRILAATNRDLERAVTEGTFRRDLFFRLNVLTLRLPALRERRQDIPLLVAHFLERIGHDAGIEKAISDEALKALLNYDWPGNVRELENSLERACALSSANEIQIRDLPTKIYGAPVDLMGMSQPSNGIVPMAELEKQTILNALVQVNGDKMVAARLLGIGKTTLYRKLKEYANP